MGWSYRLIKPVTVPSAGYRGKRRQTSTKGDPLRPNYTGDGIFCGWGGRCGPRVGSPELLWNWMRSRARSITASSSRTYFTSRPLARRRLASSGVNQVGWRFASSGSAHLVDFHQKGLDHKLLHAAGLPEHALGMNVEMKVSRLDRAQSAGFFCGFALGGLAVREAGVRSIPWETSTCCRRWY